jgi:hypothetical protein|tara:strand:- start:214 stop:540 length:327 start_codon:yes stop_codon:yes gene_type:complete
MDDKKKNKKISQQNLKFFLIKLISISIAVVVVINLMFNMIFAERLEKIDKLLSLDKSKMRNELKDKIRNELSKGLDKENMFSHEDRILLYKLYLKIKKEFADLDKTNL